METLKIELTIIEARAARRILEWANTQPRLVEMSEGDINFVGLSEAIIRKIKDVENAA